MKKITAWIIICLLIFSNVSAWTWIYGKDLKTNIDKDFLLCSQSEIENIPNKTSVIWDVIFNWENSYITYEPEYWKESIIKNWKIIYKWYQIDDFQFSNNFQNIAFKDFSKDNKRLILNWKEIDNENDGNSIYDFILTKDGDIYYHKQIENSRINWFYKNWKLISRSEVINRWALNWDYFWYKFNSMSNEISNLLWGTSYSDTDEELEWKTSFYINWDLIKNYKWKIYRSRINYINSNNYSFILEKDNWTYTIVINWKEWEKEFKNIWFLNNHISKQIKDQLYYWDWKIYNWTKIIDDDVEYDLKSINLYWMSENDRWSYIKFIWEDYYIIWKNSKWYYIIKNWKLITKNKNKIDNFLKYKHEKKNKFGLNENYTKQHDYKLINNFDNDIYKIIDKKWNELFYSNYPIALWWNWNNLLIKTVNDLYLCEYTKWDNNISTKTEIKSNAKVDKLLNKVFTKIDKKWSDKAKKTYEALIVRLDKILEKTKSESKKELIEYIKYKVQEKIK